MKMEIKLKRKKRAWFYTFIVMDFFFILALADSCNKDSASVTIETGSVTDTDGNVYKTVKIGRQWWMAENLKVKRYRNGDSVFYIGVTLDSAIWNKNKTGAYYIYDSRDTASHNYNGKIFGFLYNWYAISNQKNIAPAGWHVPTDDEWKQLEIYMGMGNDDADKVNWRGTKEGDKLKIQSGGWTIPTDQYNVWGTNESGFSAIGGGCVMFNGVFGIPGANYEGFWWTASEQDTGAWYRYLDYNKANIFRFYGPKSYGFSVRCVKDDIKQ